MWYKSQTHLPIIINFNKCMANYFNYFFCQKLLTLNNKFLSKILSQSVSLLEDSCLFLVDTFQTLTEIGIGQFLNTSTDVFSIIRLIYTWIMI
jgi:hypothetical protein